MTNSVPENAALYPGEEIRFGAGYPALVKFFPGDVDKPLVVFITGGGVLARVAYGHPEGHPPDFIAYWLQDKGYPFLAISYPIDNPVFSSVHPDFSVRDWGTQVAEIIDQHIAEDCDDRRVLVLAWSMAGRIAEPLTSALGNHKIAVELFVAMAASTALPALQPAIDQLTPSAKGLARVDGGFSEWILLCLDAQSLEAGRVTIPPDIFRRQYMGDLPVNLAATSKRFSEGRFISDPAADALDAGASKYAGFPPLALITHASAMDARHALIDKGAWAFYIQQSLLERHVWPYATKLASVPIETWACLIEAIDGAPKRLTIVQPGSHLLFLGKRGARTTVSCLQALQSEACVLRAELDSMLRSDCGA